MRAVWEWNCSPVGNMAAFYFSAEAASQYLYDLGVRLSGYSIEGSPDRNRLRLEDLGIRHDALFTVEAEDPEPVIEDGGEDAAGEYPEHSETVVRLPEARKCPDTAVPDRRSWLIYIPFDTCPFKLGGSVFSGEFGNNGDNAPDINHYDACYLPDGRIALTCTALNYAVPCVNGDTPVANLYRVNADGSGLEALTSDQEHAWCPMVMTDGRLLYLRWEYADIPHSNSRMLFACNPDGTNQRAFYGSNSFWPNSLFYARTLPGSNARFVGIATGHHGVARVGECVLFDATLGREEAQGAVQRLPGFGRRVEPIVRDQLVNASWPKCLHPYPLDDDNFLMARQPAPGAPWEIVLIDRFDNAIALRREPGAYLFEPIPLRREPKPPVIPDRVRPGQPATLYVADIYQGPGLKGIPRGAVKALRVYTYTYGFRGLGGLYGSIGVDGPWDMRRILGTWFSDVSWRRVGQTACVAVARKGA